MATWKRDFASGLIVLVPIIVTAYVIAWIYDKLASVTPAGIIKEQFLQDLVVFGVEVVRYAELIRVFISIVVFVILVFAVGYLMRTTVGTLLERVLDDLANSLPGLRVVYNASKMAAETALGGTDSLQEPVKIETWDGMRMTAFRTGKMTEDGREVIFLPTAPNITSGFVIEVSPDRIEELDERVEDALTRILSAGFGDDSRTRTPEELVGDAGRTSPDGESDDGSGERTVFSED